MDAPKIHKKLLKRAKTVTDYRTLCLKDYKREISKHVVISKQIKKRRYSLDDVAEQEWLDGACGAAIQPDGVLLVDEVEQPALRVLQGVADSSVGQHAGHKVEHGDYHQSGPTQEHHPHSSATRNTTLQHFTVKLYTCRLQ